MPRAKRPTTTEPVTEPVDLAAAAAEVGASTTTYRADGPDLEGADGSHLEGFRVPPLDAADDDGAGFVDVDGEGAPIGAADLEDVPELIDRAAFAAVFRLPWDLLPTLDPDFAPVAIAPEEEGACRAASDAAYALLEAYYPRALRPGSDALAHGLVLGQFLACKVLLVRQVLIAKRAGPLPVERPAPGSGTGTDTTKSPAAARPSSPLDAPGDAHTRVS